MLRPYQCSAINSWLNCRYERAVIEAVTASGKSHIIAAIANHNKGRVLVLAPSKELIEQDHAKYIATGNPAGFYSASKGEKSLRHKVTFGTPITVLNNVDRWKCKIDLVVIDECHLITPTIKQIIEKLGNPRVLGLTATPYRLGDGFIYKEDEENNLLSEEYAKNPYFEKLLYRITAHRLLEEGYLCKPLVVDEVDRYLTIGVAKKDIDRAFEGRGRKTSKIVNQIVELCANRQGVIIFAQTIQHAKEVMQSLPPELSAIVTGETKNRESILKRFLNRKIKYLVNVQVLTTGFDAPHVDCVAILRATDSAALLQQIIGRGLRLSQNKTDCLILDYAQNIEKHFPDGDIFNPDVRAYKGKQKEAISAECPECGCNNIFTARDNPSGFAISQYGYFLDLDGNSIDIPAHHGRKCLRCDYRWTSKVCDSCGSYNDIAARYCVSCKWEIVDPNESLVLKEDKQRTEKLIHWEFNEHISKRGNKTLQVRLYTENTNFYAWYLPSRKYDWNTISMTAFNSIAPDIDTFLKYKYKATKPNYVIFEKEGKYFNVKGFKNEIQ